MFFLSRRQPKRLPPSNKRLKLSGAARSGWVPFDEMARQQWNVG
jgi:hypothetical protein